MPKLKNFLKKGNIVDPYFWKEGVEPIFVKWHPEKRCYYTVCSKDVTGEVEGVQFSGWIEPSFKNARGVKVFIPEMNKNGSLIILKADQAILITRVFEKSANGRIIEIDLVNN